MFDLKELSAEINKFTLGKDNEVQITLTLNGNKVDLEKLKMLKSGPVYINLTSAQQTLPLED